MRCLGRMFVLRRFDTPCASFTPKVTRLFSQCHLRVRSVKYLEALMITDRRNEQLTFSVHMKCEIFYLQIQRVICPLRVMRFNGRFPYFSFPKNIKKLILPLVLS